MNAQSILDMLLNSGKELAQKGKELADKNEKIPEEGPERDALLKGLGAGAAAAGALALLLGTDAGRKIAGTALKVGSVAAIGGLGYTAYKKWADKNGEELGENALHQLSDGKADERSKAIIHAIIAAANADGHISEQERGTIEKQIKALPIEQEAAELIVEQLDAPLDADTVAKGADSREAAVEIWLASTAVIDAQNQIEKRYLARLQRALSLPDDLVAELASAE